MSIGKCSFLVLVNAVVVFLYFSLNSELCLISEIPYDLKEYENEFKTQIKNTRRHFIAIASEGIKQNSQEIADWFENSIGIESRVTVLGHIQRGCNPTITDRLMAYNFVVNAIDGLLDGKKELDSELLSYLK